ncbi:MAG: hypothetical protein WDN09_02960 [bacterium]
MKKRSVSNSPRLTELRRKRRRHFHRNAFFVLTGLFIVVTGITLLSRLPKFNISTIAVAGNTVIETDDIKAVVQADLAGHYLWVFPKTNFLLYPKHTIETDLAERFKRAKDISVNTKLLKILDVKLFEREALYTWCGDEPSTTVEQCYFMDDTGYIFDKAPYFSGNVYFKFYGHPSGSTDQPLGTYYMSDSLGRLLAFRDTLKSLGIKIASLEVDDGQEGAFYLSTAAARPDAPKILFKTDGDFNKMAENLQTALATEPLKSDFAKKYALLSYVDLRFGNKVYYKFSASGNPPPGEPASDATN